MKKRTRRVLIAAIAIALLIPLFAAFEAHVINVRAHIENALQVEPKEIDFGVVFPQEELQRDFNVRLSESFMEQERATDVFYKLVQKRKPKATFEELDVLLVFDLSGSMADDMVEVKANASDIIDGFKHMTPDGGLQVGIASHVDYPGAYDYTAECGYSATYGASTDYAWMVDQSMTADLDLAKSTIAGLNDYNGMDLPQNYARVAYESYADASLGWRPGSKKLVILFADDVPHDCDLGTGGDPGRDEVKGTADDLDWDTELANMAGLGIELHTVHSGIWLDDWVAWTGLTGGMAVSPEDSGDIVTAVEDLYSYADLRPFVTKTKIDDGDNFPDTEEMAILDKSVGDFEDNWMIDFYVPCIAGAVGQDYDGPIAPREDDYGLDIWVEVFGISYADGTTWPPDLRP